MPPFPDLNRHMHQPDNSVLSSTSGWLQTVMDNAPVILFALDTDGIFTLSEGRGLDALGLKPGELVGQSVFAVYHDVPQILDDVRRVLAGETWTGTVEVGPFTFETHYAPQRDEWGAITGAIGVSNDISARRRAEQALHERERFIQRVADSSPHLIYLYDLDEQRNVYINDAVTTMLGYTPEQIQAMGSTMLSKLMHPDDLMQFPDIMARMFASREAEAVESEYRMRHADGSWRWVAGRETVFQRAADGRPTQTLGTVQDITARKRAEDALQRSHAELEQRVAERTAELERLHATRQDLLNRLVNAQEEERRRIARELHDRMGQELTALMLTLNMMERKLPQDLAVRAYLDQLHTITHEISEEIHTLALELRPTALDDLGLHVALAHHMARWQTQSGVPVDFHSVGLKDERLPTLIETAIYRIIQEALTNVARHAKATQVSVIIERRTDDVLTIVEDNGIGFNLEGIFGGVLDGVGLAGMCERAVQVGGALQFESAPSNGTTIFVHIPLPLPTKDE